MKTSFYNFLKKKTKQKNQNKIKPESPDQFRYRLQKETKWDRHYTLNLLIILFKRTELTFSGGKKPHKSNNN